MMRSSLLLATLAIAVGVAFPGAADADAIISMNGSVNPSGTPAADGTPANTKTVYFAAGFTVNAGSSYTFSDAIAYGLNVGGPPSQGLTNYSLGSLWKGSSTGPATFVQNLTTSSITGAAGNQTYAFTPTSAITLTGGDTYWLVITATKKTWKWLTSTATSTGPGATYVGAGQGLVSGSAASPSISSFSAGPGGVAGIRVDGTRIAHSPEPSSLALLGSVGCVAALGGWQRRRRQR